MNSKYKVFKYSSNKFENIDDLVSIEEPLEISLKYNKSNKWINQSLSITMRTPGDDEDLVRGFLYNEQIIKNINDIDSIESYGDKVGQYNIQNKILATLNNSKNINISKIKRDFLTNSSCGVCGKSSLDALEIVKKNKTHHSEPKITKEIDFNDDKFNFNLNELLSLSDQEFRKKFTGSPIKRIGRDRFIRNCCIAAGNSKNRDLIPMLVNLLTKDQSSLVRGAAIWALQQLDNKKNLKRTKRRHLSFEKNKDVLTEWCI